MDEILARPLHADNSYVEFLAALAGYQRQTDDRLGGLEAGDGEFAVEADEVEQAFVD